MDHETLIELSRGYASRIVLNYYARLDNFVTADYLRYKTPLEHWKAWMEKKYGKEQIES